MFKVITKRETFYFQSRVELINWLSQFNTLDIEHQKVNPVLFAMATPGDNSKRCEPAKTGCVLKSAAETLSNPKNRFYRPSNHWIEYSSLSVVDPRGYSLYMGDLADEVLVWEYDESMETHRLLWWDRVQKNQREKRILSRSDTPGYRNGAVPHTGKLGVWRGYRSPRTTAELRAMQDPETRKYSRSRRRCLPTQYDDLTNHSYGIRCWKQTTHDRHQWERGIRNNSRSRGKGMEVSSFASIGEVLAMEYQEYLEFEEAFHAEAYQALEEYAS